MISDVYCPRCGHKLLVDWEFSEVYMIDDDSAADGKLPVIISVYGIGWDENYADAEKREPIFSGTAYEYIEKFGKEQ